jgi:hypothetical protein
MALFDNFSEAYEYAHKNKLGVTGEDFMIRNILDKDYWEGEMRNIKPTQEVWFVSGCEEGYLFETKLDAEIHARIFSPMNRAYKIRTYLFQNRL